MIINYIELDIDLQGRHFYFTVKYKDRESGRVICHIPAYDILFSAEKPQIEKKAKALVELFFEHLKAN